MATSKSTPASKPPVTKPAAKKTTAATATPKATAKKATGKATTAKTPAAVKPATTVRKPAEKTVKPVVPEKKAAAPAKATPAKTPAAPTPEQRYRMVQDAAYFIAEKNGFKAGSMDYWIAAEAEIAVLLSGKEKK